MDLAEYALSETDRILKRLGVTHVWREAPETKPVASPVAETVVAETAPASAPPLPALLRSLFHGKQPPIVTMWSYAALHGDLQAVIAPPRLELFRKIQDAACAQGGWNSADICVWPLVAPPHILDAGLKFFQPRLIVFFGPLPADGDQSPSLGQPLLHGIPVRLLPSLDIMVAGDQAAKSSAWDVLKNLPPRHLSEP